MEPANKYSFLFLFIFSISAGNAGAVYQAIEKHPETVLGEKAYASGQYDEAMVHFQKAIDDGETRGEPYFFTGAIMEYRRQYADAIPWYAAALEHELTPELEKIALWKLIILYRNERNYIEMLSCIDRLEALGVSHRNIESFKEEAAQALTPSKLEAYTLLKEARAAIADFEKEQPRAEFWDADQNGEKTRLVVENYERAIYLDGDLFSLNWELAGYYEKLRNYDKAFNIYRKIIQKENHNKALYRAGVVLKKAGRFQDSLRYLDETLSKSSGNPPLRYYTLINISQVLFALERFEEGERHAYMATEMEKSGAVTAPPFPVAQLMRCLHATATSIRKEGSGPVAIESCQKSLTAQNQKAAPMPLVPLYRYTAWSYHLLTKKDSKEGPRLVSQILIPPKLQNSAGTSAELALQKPLDCDKIENDKTANWNCLPNWMYGEIPRMSSYLFDTQNWRQLLTVLVLYPAHLTGEQHDSWLGAAYFGLNDHERAIQVYRNIRERSFEDEKRYLLSLARQSRWEELQTEALSFHRNLSYSQHQEKQLLIEFIKNENIPLKIPQGEIRGDFRLLFGPPEEPREDPETVNDSGGDSVSPDTRVPENPGSVERENTPENVPNQPGESTNTPQVENALEH